MPRFLHGLTTSRSLLNKLKRFHKSAVARNSSVVILLSALLAVSFITALPYEAHGLSNAQIISPWIATKNYHTEIGQQSCTQSTKYVYCVGGTTSGSGYTNAAYYASLSDSGTTKWKSTTSYPTDIGAQSCVISSGYMYCIGGQISSSGYTNAIYFASVSSTGIGGWGFVGINTYPTDIAWESCAVSSGYVYCVGGQTGSSSDTDAVYYAPISSSGVGTWTQTTSYPVSLADLSCVISSGYIYCVGGYNGSYTNAVYYAPISSSGVGAWSSATPYPRYMANGACVTYSGYILCLGGYDQNSAKWIHNDYIASISSSGVGTWEFLTEYPTDIGLESCVTYSSYVYCIGGYNNSKYIDSVYYSDIFLSGYLSPWGATTNYPSEIIDQACSVASTYIYCVGGEANSSTVDNVYYTSLSSSGVGNWSRTTSYPIGIFEQSCAINSGYIYCVGGQGISQPSTDAVYYATVSSSGVGTWKSTTSYPTTVFSQDCAIYSGYIYCVGGSAGGFYSSAAYYATVNSSGVGTWESTAHYPAAILDQSCAIYSGYIYCVGGSELFSNTNATYYAPVSSSGIGSWKSTTSYPASQIFTSCVASSGYLYCIGGTGESSAYASITSSGVGTWAVTTNVPANEVIQSCNAYSGYIYCVDGTVYYAAIL
jgi:hypothetical protein